MTDEHVARLNSVLRSAIRLSEYSNRDIERKLGFSGGYLSRLFGGHIDIKMSHILNVLEIIGLYPAEFFQMTFPPNEGGEPSPLMKKILDMTPQARPIGLATPPAAQPPALTPREIQEKIVDALRLVFADLEKPRR